MVTLPNITSAFAILLAGAIFGFFYAWVCSTMWGLDQADPRVAMDAMKAMNASVRNAVFFPAFFLTPLALAAAAYGWHLSGQSTPMLFFGAAALIYLFGGLILTMTINVPMNEALAATPTPSDIEAARKIWLAYSQPWQFWNVARTLASGGALLLGTIGIVTASQST